MASNNLDYPPMNTELLILLDFRMESIAPPFLRRISGLLTHIMALHLKTRWEIPMHKERFISTMLPVKYDAEN